MSSHRPTCWRRSRWRFLWLVAALAPLGCGERDAISTYETPRTEPRLTKADPANVAATLDHMFVAIVPAGRQAWFFKVVAPGAAAEGLRGTFDEFLATVKADDSGDVPAWTLPAEWTAGPARDMVAATILIPHGDEKLEMTVSSLPLSGDWAAFVKQNVARWMDQLQQPRFDFATIEKLRRELPTADRKATTFELVGVMQRRPMGGLGGMPAGHPPLEATAPTREEAPTSNGPTSDGGPATTTTPSATAANQSTSGAFAFDAPADWRPGPRSVMGFQREASFATDDGATIAVTAFSASGQMADPRANAMRWAGEVGMTDLSDEALDRLAARFELDGGEGRRFELTSPDGVQPAKSVSAAMIVRDGQAWFFKLSGLKAAVDDQRAAFDEFLSSVKFAADK